MAAKSAEKPHMEIKIQPPDRERVTYETVLNINFYKKKKPFYGSIRGMRYRLAREADKDEEGNESNERFKLSVWEEPFCYEATEPEKIKDFIFDFDEEGRKKAVDKINEEYNAAKEYWNKREGYMGK